MRINDEGSATIMAIDLYIALPLYIQLEKKAGIKTRQSNNKNFSLMRCLLYLSCSKYGRESSKRRADSN
jgi:hypothetical protein